MKTKTQKPKKPTFDREGYQIGAPHIQGEPIDFRIAKVLPRNFLPSPRELAGKTPQTKITLAVDDDALAFFKSEAQRLGTSYQRMLRNLISTYVRQIKSP
jgi:hypothetical protein